jgi:phage terminase large subunit-like protein
MVRLACERYENDKKRADLYFDASKFLRFVRFAQTLKHFKGEFAGKVIRLEDWQLFVAANVFGWYRKATKRRRYQYADVYVPRKNGKTTLAAIIALYMLLFDGEPAAEVYAAAVDKEQAKICFDTAKELLRNSDLTALADIYRGSIVRSQSASAFKPLTKDTKNKDGLNPHAAICDERHAWKTNEIYDVIKTGIGSRRQPLVFSISTAGVDTSYPYFRDLEFLRDVMNGIQEKDNHFIMLFEPDEGDRWDDPEVWRKVNPNYGVSLYPEYMESEFQEAKKKGGSTLAAFCTKNLNMWVDAPEVWISDDDVAANGRGLDPSVLLGQECYVGLDLASKNDITAAAFWFPAFKAVRYLFCVPESKVAEMSDRVDYRQWRERGWLVVTPGKTLDEDWYIQTLISWMDLYDVKKIAYDPWAIWNILPKFGRYCDRLMEYQQNIRYMSVPTKWLEAAVLRHELDFLGDPVIRWMFRNVVIYRDPNANIKLDKARSRNKIDGVVATVDAIGGWLNDTSGQESKIIYTNHDLRVI